MTDFANFKEYMTSKKAMQDKPKVCVDGDNIDVPTPKAKEDPLKKQTKARPQIKEEEGGEFHRQTLQEYLDAKKKPVSNPKEEEVPDYNGPQETRPPKDITKGKDWEAPHADKVGDVAPYKAANPGRPGSKGETGFGDLGDKGLIYKPDIAKANLPKTKTEQFIDSTKDMSLGEFTNFVTKQSQNIDEATMPFITAYQQGPIRPYPAETIRYLTALTSENPRVMENLIHEMRRSGQLEALIKAVLEYPDAYKNFAELLEGEGGEKRCKNLARALRQMSEAVGPAIGFDDDEEEGEFNPGNVKDDDGSDGSDEKEGGEEDPDAGLEGEEGEPEPEGGKGDEEDFGLEIGAPGADIGKPPKKPNLTKALESYGLA